MTDAPAPVTGSRALPPELDPRVEPGRPAKRRTGGIAPRLARVATAAVSAFVVLLSLAGWTLDKVFDHQISRVDAFGFSAHRPQKTGDAVNYLLVGSDRRDGMTAADIKRLHVGRADGQRADTMILVHVSRTQQKATLLSFPRDSYVDIPGHGRDKLNAAYAFGGAALAVQTIEAATSIHIDHYLEINFLGFEKMVNALGGIEVCSARPLRDEKANLALPAGRHTLNGTQGLAYVRARYVDGRGDLGRIQRQQQFLGAIVRKATSRGILLDTSKLTSFIGATLRSLRADNGLHDTQLLQLGKALHNLTPSGVTFLTVPLADVNYRVPSVGSTVLWDDAAAKALFTAVRDDRPVTAVSTTRAAPVVATVRPADIRVRVLNGTAIRGLGRRAADSLRSAGFAVAGSPGNATSTGASLTVIRYDSRYGQSVKTLQAALPGARLEKVEGLGATFQVVAGSSWTGARRVVPGATPVATPPASPAALVPTQTAAANPCR